MEYDMTMIWLGLMVIFLVIEFLTVGLTTIWLAGGALVALLLSLTGLHPAFQVAAFLVISFVLVFVTRPLAMKYVNFHHEKTNCEELIGKTVRITEKVDNLDGTGQAVINGMTWTARTEKDDEILYPGELATVLRISGVKLIVKKIKEEV